MSWIIFVAIILVGGGYLIFRGERGTSTVQQNQPQEKKIIVDDNEVSTAPFVDVSGSAGKGIAYQRFTKGIFIHTINATLKKPPAGFFYEGWLVKGHPGSDDFKFISTGKLRLEIPSDLFWTLVFSNPIDYSEYKNVIITLEKDDDQKPEKHILEGTF